MNLKFKNTVAIFLASAMTSQAAFAGLSAADMAETARSSQQVTDQRAERIVSQNEELLKEIQKVEVQIAVAKDRMETNQKDTKRSAVIAISVGLVFGAALAAGVGATFMDSSKSSLLNNTRNFIVAVSERIITLGLGAKGEEGQMRLIAMFIGEMMVAAGFGVNAGVNYVQVEFFNKKELASLELMLSNLKTRLQAENLQLK